MKYSIWIDSYINNPFSLTRGLLQLTDLQFAHVSFNFILCPESIKNNLQVQFTHSSQNCLTCVTVLKRFQDSWKNDNYRKKIKKSKKSNIAFASLQVQFSHTSQNCLTCITLLKYLAHYFFLNCSPYSYRSPKTCDSNSCPSFSLIQTIKKCKGTLYTFT